MSEAAAWPSYDPEADPIEKREADAATWRAECEAREKAGLNPTNEQACLDIIEQSGLTADDILAATFSADNDAPTDPMEIRVRALERQLQRVAQLCGINLLEIDT